MTVDFSFRNSPRLRVATVRWKGGYSEPTIRKHFEQVEKWARSKGIPTGRWVFREPGDRTWETSIEIKKPAHSEGRIKVRNLPAARVASVTFDPDVVSPRVVYHGLSDWLRWRKKEKEIRSVVSYRELYGGNPWKDPKVWARTEVQFVVRK